MSKKAQIQQKPESEQAKIKPANIETQPLETAVSPIPVLQRAYADPSNITPNDARILQRTIGNQAVRRLVIQRKMTVGPVGDKYEQEADAVAKQVVSKINTPQQDVAQRQEEDELQMMPISTVQRQEEDEDVQMKPSSTMGGGELASDVEGRIQSAKGGGRSLDSNTQSSMGQAFNADFSGVNIHTNGQSDTLNRSLQARAFTSGQDIFFRSGEYSPNSSGGQELLAHELTHLVQQNGVSTKTPLQRSSHLTSGCNCPSCTGTLQRKPTAIVTAGETQPPLQQINSKDTIQHKLQGRIIQREILKDWATEHVVYHKGGKAKKASKAMKKLTVAVTDYNNTPRRIYDTRTVKLDVIQTRIDKWRKTRHKKDPNRVIKVDSLEQAIPGAKQLVASQKAEEEQQIAEANTRRDRFMLLEPELAEFAVRHAPDVSNFMPDQTYATDPLTQPRGPNGTLTEQAISDSEAAKQKEKTDNLKLGDEGSITGDPSVNDLEKIMAEELNEETGETLYPELANLKNPNNETDQISTKAVSMGGTTVMVRYNESDVNFDTRLNLVKAAFEKVKLAGFTIPPIDVNLPKLGRKLTVSSTCKVTVSGKSNRAVFVPPAFMHISSENVQNPLTDKSSSDPNKFKNLSTELDPSGIGTIIHELGHVLHYNQVPGKYYGLSETLLKDNETKERATHQVSEYGSNPREMVAEVFLGMIYGKTFSPEIMQMYTAFGGPVKG